MEGNSLRVYIDNNLVLQATDTSLKSGAASLISSKVDVSFDNIKVLGNVEESPDDIVEIPEDEVVEIPKDEIVSEDTSIGSVVLDKYSVTGFSYGNIGGGAINETSTKYVKVSNATELAAA